MSNLSAEPKIRKLSEVEVPEFLRQTPSTSDIRPQSFYFDKKQGIDIKTIKLK